MAIMDTPMPMVLDMDMLSLDTATLMSAASWERGQLRLMLNLDITDILMDIMGIPMLMVTDMDMLSPDTATLMSAESWERGQLRLMPNLDITDILMDMDITDTPIIMDTVLLDLESLDMLVVEPLLLPEALKVSVASKTAIFGFL